MNAISIDGGVALPGVDLLKGVRKGLKLMATVFTNAGAAVVTNRMIQSGRAPKNIGWGTGTTAAAVTDTALQTEAAPTTSGGRVVGTEARTTVSVSTDNYQVTGTVTATSSLAITEARLFDAVIEDRERGDYFVRHAQQQRHSAQPRIPGPGTPVAQKLQVTFTPQVAGRVRGRIRLGKPSTTVWVNPQIAVT